jgi:hypothetical protein
VIVAPSPEWALFIPYQLTTHPYSLLDLTLTCMGLMLVCVGISISFHYARERTWYMKQLQKAHITEELELQRRTGRDEQNTSP